LYKAIILEDNLSDALSYEMLLKKLGVYIQAVHKNYKEILPSIRKEKPDFMIVDLQLASNQKGIEFIEEIQNLFIPIVVVTGYPKDSLVSRALELNVNAFLTKPIDTIELQYVIQKLVKELKQNEYQNENLLIKSKASHVIVPFEKIIKIEVDGNYSSIELNDDRRYLMKKSLSKILEKLSKKFFRCHRSTVVNFEYVEMLDKVRNRIILKNGEELPVGNRFRSSVRRMF